MLRRALVVDDQPALLRVYRRYLEGLGWEVDAACDGRAALKAFSQGAYGLLVCDADLGRLDGIVIARAFKEIEPALAVVIISGSAGNFERARDAGFPKCLQKPFDLSELRHAIESS